MLGRVRMFGAGCVALVVSASSACLGYATPDDDALSGIELPERQPQADASGSRDSQPIEGPDLDAGAPPDADAAPDVAKKPLRAFVSSALRDGNLGGVAGADALCTTLAAGKLGGTYKAWLSVPGTNAIDRITSAGPWQLVTGEVVADNKAGLTVAQLKRLLDRDENGVKPPDAEDRVWTGTAADGTYAGPDCTAWAGGGSGRVGEANNGGTNSWTSLGTEACSEVNRIYCLEQ